MNEPVCFPVCPKCKDGCELSSKVKTAPVSTGKTRTWRPDIVELKCGQTVPSPIFMLGKGTEVWCEIHDKWEKIAAKKTGAKWRESPVDEIPF